jgi:argininosuccinate lyase
MKLWGGNYAADPDRRFWEFNRSFPFDQRLLREELLASRAWVAALQRCGALRQDEAERLDAGLARILERAQQQPGYLDLDAEDVHSFVETRLHEEVGDLAGQAHLGRSRNEQTVTALRLWLKAANARLQAHTRALALALVERGLAGADVVMAGFTHTRAAEPITFGHWAAAYAAGLLRDHERLADAYRRCDVLPLGSGALAGSALALDREALARALGFAACSRNALDAVMDRDFAAEAAFACAQIQTRLSRLAEDLIWFSGPEFGYFGLPEAYTTGSSLMPQKQNPDALELVRGKSARVHASVQRLLGVQKGLPAGYQKDLQEDKEALFDACDTVEISLEVTTGVVAGLTLKHDALRRSAAQPEMMAAGLAVALAQDGLPFRQAHGLVGALVAQAQREARPLAQVAAERLEAHPRVAARLDALFDPVQAAGLRAVAGGTAPDAVRVALQDMRARLEATPPTSA